MSVIVPISNLTPAIIKKLDKDLHVKPIVQPLKSPVKLSSKLVEAFDKSPACVIFPVCVISPLKVFKLPLNVVDIEKVPENI
jgi:hypothetical protein